MKFTIKPEAIERLGLPATTIGREFNGYPMAEGLLASIPRGIIKWAKRELHVTDVGEWDVIDRFIVYFLLAIRNTDHALLPFSRFDDIAMGDFTISPHPVFALDKDGDCAECTQPRDARVHLVDEDGGAPEPRPTTVLVGQETTGTQTPSSPDGGSSS